MAVERQAISLDLGIEDNLDADSPEVLESLFGEDLPTPGKVTKAPKAEAPKKKEVKAQAKTEDEEEPIEYELSEDDLLNELEDEDEDDADTTDEEKPPVKEQEKADESTEDDVEDTDQEETEDSEETEETSENMWKDLSTDLFKMGILQLGEDEEEPEITTPAELKERLTLEKKRDAALMLENFISAKGKKYEDAFQAIWMDGVEPDQYFKGQTAVDSFRELDLSKEENQKYVIRRSLTQQGWDEEDINDELEKLDTYADLENSARKHHKVLLKDEEKKLESERNAAIARQNKEKETKKEFQDNVVSTLKEKVTSKDYDGIPVSREFAESTLDFVTNEKYVTEDGKRLTEWDKLYLESKRPENHQMLVKLAMLAQLIQKDPTLSTIKRKVNTDKVNQEFSTLTRKGIRKSAAPAKTTTSSKKPFI